MLLEDRIRKLVSDQAGIGFSDVATEDHLEEDLGFDDLDMFEFTMSLEEEYGIEIPYDKIKEWKTVEDVVYYIHKETDQE